MINDEYMKNYQYVEDKIKQIYRFGDGLVNLIDRNELVFLILEYVESNTSSEWWEITREEEFKELLKIAEIKEDEELNKILDEISDYECIFQDTLELLQIERKKKEKYKESIYLLPEEQYALKKWYVVSKAIAKAQRKLIEKIIDIAGQVPANNIPEARYYINKHIEVCTQDMHLYCMVWHMLEYEYKIDNTINIVNELNF